MKRNSKKIRWKNPFNSDAIADRKIITLLYNLAHAFVTGYPKNLSNALSSRGGTHCKDCEKYFTECTCEGDTEISGPCRYCKQNYCICEFMNNSTLDPQESLRKSIWIYVRNKYKDSFNFDIFTREIYSEIRNINVDNSEILSKFKKLYYHSYLKFNELGQRPAKNQPDALYNIIDQIANEN